MGTNSRIGRLAVTLSLALGGCASSAAYDAAAVSSTRLVNGQAEVVRHFTVIDVPLTIHFATLAGEQVVSHASMQQSLRRANLALAAFGVRLYVRAFEVLPEGYSSVTESDERIRLAELSRRDGTVHVFFVDRVTLFNARRTDGRVSGMHWRYHGLTSDLRRREYVVVAGDAPDTTLVHELGHTFGLDHETEPENLMCSCRRSDLPVFSAAQGKKIRSGARMYLLRSR
jgi:hypothetical protein